MTNYVQLKLSGGATVPTTDTPNTVATFDRLASVVGDIVIGTSVTALQEIQSTSIKTGHTL